MEPARPNVRTDTTRIMKLNIVTNAMKVARNVPALENATSVTKTSKSSKKDVTQYVPQGPHLCLKNVNLVANLNVMNVNLKTLTNVTNVTLLLLSLSFM
jgi:hypothetical protein